MPKENINVVLVDPGLKPEMVSALVGLARKYGPKGRTVYLVEKGAPRPNGECVEMGPEMEAFRTSVPLEATLVLSSVEMVPSAHAVSVVQDALSVHGAITLRTKAFDGRAMGPGENLGPVVTTGRHMRTRGIKWMFSNSPTFSSVLGAWIVSAPVRELPPLPTYATSE